MKIERFETLRFTNKYMFATVLKEDPELCKEIIEAILDVKIREIIRTNSEETIETSSTGHGVRLDVYLEGDDAIYDIEMQTADKKNLPKRSRYYQGILDTDYLDQGSDYNSLKKTYVIFICTFDLFGKDLCKYTFRNYCDEDKSLGLNDDSVKVFVNTNGRVESASPELVELLRYVKDEEVTGDLTKKLDGRVRNTRRNERRRAEYMTWEWELEYAKREAAEKARTQGLEEGRAEGRAVERSSIIKMMLNRLTPREIVDLGFSAEEVEAAKK